MLLVLHIHLFLMSFDSGGMSLGDREINYAVHNLRFLGQPGI